MIPNLSGGPLKDVYVFERGHFHWGKNDKKGSEHTIHCNRFPLELHLVHYRRGYGSVKEAMNYKDGLVVIGIIFQIKSEFITYKGSLTTPPCTETVTWIISKQLSTVNPTEVI
ncbi:carbonic anhydrase-like [Leptopilina heterotoma]|uniref:carbonic anhydrase-like n=1 Tax=Leptopilina heterotoma TaxID=63436 RepID=UPI001CA7F755|nr:carbonic anhydrase-like [Leptopilina heterotoma]